MTESLIVTGHINMMRMPPYAMIVSQRTTLCHGQNLQSARASPGHGIGNTVLRVVMGRMIAEIVQMKRQKCVRIVKTHLLKSAWMGQVV